MNRTSSSYEHGAKSLPKQLSASFPGPVSCARGTGQQCALLRCQQSHFSFLPSSMAVASTCSRHFRMSLSLGYLPHSWRSLVCKPANHACVVHPWATRNKQTPKTMTNALKGEIRLGVSCMGVICKMTGTASGRAVHRGERYKNKVMAVLPTPFLAAQVFYSICECSAVFRVPRGSLRTRSVDRVARHP